MKGFQQAAIALIPLLSGLSVSIFSPAQALDLENAWGNFGYNWVGDFNGDGRDDIASALPNDEVVLRLSTGRGFQATTWKTPEAWGASAYIWAEDFDQDGKTDLVSALGDKIAIHLAQGDGVKTSFKTTVVDTPSRWGDKGYNWTGDFNGDGTLDIASAHPDGDVSLRLFNGTDFDLETWSISTVWGGYRYVWVEDFNQDGKTDLASALGDELFLHLSTGRGFNSSTTQTPLTWGGKGYNWAGDFNQDGLVDIVSALPKGDVTMRFFDGSSFELDKWNISTPWGGGGYTWAGDFNNDGLLDVVSALFDETFIHLAQGDRFDSKTIKISGWGDAASNFTGDFDGDGNLDILSVLEDRTLSMRRFTGETFEVSNWNAVAAP